ncbi:CopM family metallochaperone [Limnobaculum zhutongyuii]|nr:DUF305 domain-containing protein [Limnobaculum zhutongyuii]
MKKSILVSLLLFFIWGAVIAAEPVSHSVHQQVSAMDKGSLTPAGKEYAAAMSMMHEPMMAAVRESDPDVAFVKGMIPHHQGAIEMARIELKYGKNPEIRKLAEAVINAQEQEIDTMNRWLAEHNNSVK